MIKINSWLNLSSVPTNVIQQIIRDEFWSSERSKIINTNEGRDRCQNWSFPPDNAAHVQVRFCQRNIDACPPITGRLMLGTFADFPLRIFAIWYLSYLSSGRRIKEWNKFEKIYSNKISGDNAQEKWGKVTSLAYRTLGRPRLVGFFVPVLALFESQRGSKIHSNKISWNLLRRGNWLQQVPSNWYFTEYSGYEINNWSKDPFV